MSTINLRAFPIIPRSRLGKAFLAIILVAFISTGLSVFGLVFNDPRLIGPFPETVAWHYFWYGIMHLVLIGTYLFLFKPWADSIDDSVIGPQPSEDELEEPRVVSK